MTNAEKAVSLYAKGYNCAQAVFAAFCEDYGLDMETGLKLTSGFGGGMCAGEVCGAVSGAILVIGQRCGFHKEGEQSQKAYCNKKTREFLEEFKKQYGTVICRDLLKIECEAPSSGTQKKPTKICSKAIESAARILESIDTTE